MTNRPFARDLQAQLIQAGFTFARKTKHGLLYRHTDGRTFLLAHSFAVGRSQDSRALRNAKKDLAKALQHPSRESQDLLT